MKLQSIFLALVSLLSVGASASAAVDVDALVAVAEKSPANAAANLKAGQALYESRQHAKAKTYLARGGNEAQPWLALVELEDYRFDDAADRASKYLASKHDVDGAGHRLAEDVVRRVEIARAMLDRVEKVQVIDSLVVGRDDFFKVYGISPSTGRIAGTMALPKGMQAAGATTVYVSEDGDRMMWGAPDASGSVHLVESTHLADGTWETPHAIGDNLQLGGNANYPFLLSDGMTLYYASDGEESLGGYDIYITRNDGDRYLNPQNLGMPYNSPMDDYLLAIDDATGAGWWATDRNLIPDSVTIYMFVPQELRDNYPVDGTPDLVDRARITSIAATQLPSKDYDAIRQNVRAAKRPVNSVTAGEFALSLPDGRVITRLDMFTEPEARELMGGLIAEREDLARRKANLIGLRRAYASGDKSVADEIIREETEIADMAQQLMHLQNDVIKAEIRD